MPDADERFIRELDLLRSETRRDVDRLDAEIRERITAGLYLQAQKQYGERVEELRERMTTIETERRGDALERERQRNTATIERQRERNATRLMLAGAGLALTSSVGIELLHLVAR